jgi:hypothetical protein
MEVKNLFPKCVIENYKSNFQNNTNILIDKIGFIQINNKTRAVYIGFGNLNNYGAFSCLEQAIDKFHRAGTK